VITDAPDVLHDFSAYYPRPPITVKHRDQDCRISTM